MQRGLEWIRHLRAESEEMCNSPRLSTAAQVALLTLDTVAFHDGERPWGDVFAVSYDDEVSSRQLAEIAIELLANGAATLRNPHAVFTEADGELHWTPDRCLLSITPEGHALNESWSSRVQYHITRDEADELLDIARHVIHQEVRYLLDYEVSRYGRKVSLTPSQAATLRRRVEAEEDLQLGSFHAGIWYAARNMIAQKERTPRMAHSSLSGYLINQMSSSWTYQAAIPVAERKLYSRSKIPIRTYTDVLFGTLLDINPVEASFAAVRAAIMRRVPSEDD
ncbi:hypothetical protein [Nanchangia anserum]|uniref:hypothetical protein n=1 Tax=Nanchangia anserum TaxID=2692125 RepID=UPI002234591E|nr:hypothetical protein [Nanchangia anserum]